MNRRTLSMILCLAAASFTTMANSQEPVCHDDGSGADSAVCANQGFVRADAQLNDAYRAALDLLGSDTERADARAALVAAQRQWIKFRDADCQVQDRIFQHGTLRAAIVASCLTNLTEQRTTELKKLWLP